MTSIDYSHRNGESYSDRKKRLRKEAEQIVREHLQSVVDALVAAGHKVKDVDLKPPFGWGYWNVDGHTVKVASTIVEKSGWSGEPNGQFRYAIESYPWKETIFTKKGVLDVDRFVKNVEQCVEQQKVRAAAEKRRQSTNESSHTVYSKLKVEFAPKDPYPSFLKTEDGVPGVTVKFSKLNEEQARAILLAAVAAGVKLD